VEDGFKFRAFGTGFSLSCTLDFNTFIESDEKEMLFYEIFLQ